MASDQQIALSRHRNPASHVTKTSRQVVPAFLQKLYEMVNDPKNTELIRWSDAGDSFFVLDHERFAREVLGRWFKHQNFSSFVRQLNMYGFHKIPHLQQGVLRSETDTEFWNFAHANFHRGQPDLLCLIQRKKQMSQPGDDNTMDMRDATTPSSTPAGFPSGQLLDIHSIVQGITAIKRHQSAISTELSELRQSNAVLWKNALESREKYQKQQDTINRIVKFLAGVFGNRANAHKEDVVDSLPSHTVVPRRRTQLMIEDGRRDGGGKAGIKEVMEKENAEDQQFYGTADSPMSLFPYPSVETPGSIPSPAPSDSVSPLITETSTLIGAYNTAPNVLNSNANDIPALDTHQHLDTGVASSQQQYLQAEPVPVTERTVTPTRLSSTSLDFDPRIQGVLNQLTPSQIQQLLASLAVQSIDPLQPTSEVSREMPSSVSTQLTSYQPPFDLSQYIPLVASTSPPPPVEGLISFDPTDADTAHRMEKQWKATEDIDKDVNALNSSINSLIQNLGLDPNVLQASQMEQEADASVLDPLPAGPVTLDEAIAVAPPPQDFDFDSFFNTLTTNDSADYGDASTAFLDEVPPPSDNAASPITHLQHPSPDTQKHTQKRKSEVSELEVQDTKTKNNMSSGAKSKRRKDK